MESCSKDSQYCNALVLVTADLDQFDALLSATDRDTCPVVAMRKSFMQVLGGSELAGVEKVGRVEAIGQRPAGHCDYYC